MAKQRVMEELTTQFRISGSQSRELDRIAAERIGVNATDFQCLDVVHRAGSLTAGELAAEAGLTTGAVTAVIDRLERAGYARRVRDADDRRRVRVEVTSRLAERAEAIWGPMTEEWWALMERYTTEQLNVMVELVRGWNELSRPHIERLQSVPSRTSSEDAPAST